MIGRIFLGIVVAVIAFALLRALITGTLLIEDAGRTMPVNRADYPAGFWTMFSIGVLTIAIFVWVLFL